MLEGYDPPVEEFVSTEDQQDSPDDPSALHMAVQSAEDSRVEDQPIQVVRDTSGS
jgi:hypothetical protein